MLRTLKRCNKYTKCLFSIDMLPVDSKVGILLFETFGALFEALDGVITPPLPQVPIAIVESTVVVETVNQFMANNGTDRTKIMGRGE